MQTYKFFSTSGVPYQVNVPEPLAGLTSSYFFSFHKSGSTLLDNLISEYCSIVGIPFFSIFNSAFDIGIPTREIQKDTLVCFSDEGMMYLGFRHYPVFDLDLGGSQVVLLTRDPRDMLVSMYYSIVKSHVLPKENSKFLKIRQAAEQMNIDEFVLEKVTGYVNTFQKYQQKLQADNLITYRYEDVIYEKQDWLRDMVEKLGLPLDKKIIKKVVAKFDIFPKQEDEYEHIRQVHPGNYKLKLRAQTIEVLNTKLKEFLNHYNYS